MGLTDTLKAEQLEKDYIKKPEDAITISVMEDLKRRADLGVKKYGTTLQSNNKDNFINHAYEEALDLAQYLKKEMSVIPIIQQIIDQCPNDNDLGKNIRNLFQK
jgi:hypothetical protein